MRVFDSSLPEANDQQDLLEDATSLQNNDFANADIVSNVSNELRLVSPFLLDFPR